VFNARTGILLAVLLTAGPALSQEPKVQDPTRPYEAIRTVEGGNVIAEEFVLTAVLVSERRRIAVINGGIYQEGDLVNGELISRIDPGSILIRRGNEDIRVMLRQMRATNNDGELGQ